MLLDVLVVRFEVGNNQEEYRWTSRSPGRQIKEGAEASRHRPLYCVTVTLRLLWLQLRHFSVVVAVSIMHQR